MDIVLLEGLGVSDQVLERHSRRLEGLGHVLTVYEKNTGKHGLFMIFRIL